MARAKSPWIARCARRARSACSRRRLESPCCPTCRRRSRRWRVSDDFVKIVAAYVARVGRWWPRRGESSIAEKLTSAAPTPPLPSGTASRTWRLRFFGRAARFERTRDDCARSQHERQRGDEARPRHDRQTTTPSARRIAPTLSRESRSLVISRVSRAKRDSKKRLRSSRPVRARDRRGTRREMLVSTSHGSFPLARRSHQR